MKQLGYVIFAAVCLFAIGGASGMIGMLKQDPESRFFQFGLWLMSGSWMIGVAAILVMVALREFVR